MLEAYEQNLLREYLCNLVSSEMTNKRTISALCCWLEDNAHLLGEEEPEEDFYDLLSAFQSAVKSNSNTRRLQSRLCVEMDKLLTPPSDALPPSQLETNLHLLGDELMLNNNDRIIFGLLVRYNLCSHIEDLLDKLIREGVQTQILLPLITGIDRRLVSG
jgi:hypothetical protein